MMSMPDATATPPIPCVAAISDSGVLSFSVDWTEFLRVVRMGAEWSEGWAVDTIDTGNALSPKFFLREFQFPCTRSGRPFLLRGSSGGTPLCFRAWLAEQCAGTIYVWDGSEPESRMYPEVYGGAEMKNYRDILLVDKNPRIHLFWNLKGLKGRRLERLLQIYTDWGIPEVLPVLGGDEQALALALGRFFDQVLP